MAKSFSTIKKGLGLLDFFVVGKYAGCRVDSIVEQDRNYIEFTRKEYGFPYLPEVLDLVSRDNAKQLEREIAENAKFIATWNPWNAPDTDWDDDIPF